MDLESSMTNVLEKAIMVSLSDMVWGLYFFSDDG